MKAESVSIEVPTASVNVIVLVDVLWWLWRFLLYLRRFLLYQWMLLYWLVFSGGCGGSYCIYGGSYYIGGCSFIGGCSLEAVEVESVYVEAVKAESVSVEAE